jgi:Bacterial Ig-like domain
VNTGSPSFNTSDLYQFDHRPEINRPDPPSFTVIGETGGARPSYIGIATATESGTTVTVTTTSPDGLSTGNSVTIAEAGVPGYDGGYTVASVLNPTTFTATSTAKTPPTGLANSTGGTINNPVSTLETTLDVEWAHAIAPAAKIVLIEMTNGLQGADVANAVQTAASASVKTSVVSMSFGFGEFGGETGGSTYSFDDGLFTAAGVTYIASTGDNGAPGGYPSFSPNVLAVGATNLTLNTDNSYQGETGWSNPAKVGGNSGGSGGGISTVETSQPAYQQGTVTKVTQSTTNRTIPDVSFVGGSPTPVETYDSFGKGGPIFNTLGTSVSAPCWAGLIAIADQGLALRRQPLLDSHTALQTDLYDLPLSDFHDITSGNNTFAAGTGYDLVTGIGSPVANLLIPDLAGTSIDYTVPTAGRPHQLVLRKDGANVELLDNGVVVATQPVNTISNVNITDPNSSNDSLTVDYAFDGIFAAQVDFDHTVSSGFDTVTVNAPNGPSNTISVNENPDVTGAGSIIVDGATQTINFQTDSEVDVNAGSGGDTITLNGQGGKSGLSKVNVDGGAGNDTLIVDSSKGLFATPTNNSAGIFFNGGGGFDRLVLQQTNGTTQTSDVYSPGPNPGEGIDVITGPSGTQTVSFQNLAPVYDNVPGPLTVVGTPSNNTINYEQGPNSLNPAAPYNGDSTGLVTVDNFESLEFSHKTTLTLQGQNGDDSFVVNNTTTPTGLTAINVDGQLGNNTLVVDANNQPVLSSMITATQVNIPGATTIPVGYTNVELVRVINAKDALASTGAVITNAVEGLALTNVLVGTFNFTDPVPAPVFGSSADFTATINWGDGSPPTAGTIVQASPTASGQVVFQVFGTHTYDEESAPSTPYQISVAVTDKGSTRSFTPTVGVPTQIVDNPGASTTTPAAGTAGAAQATVLDAPLFSSNGTEITGIEGNTTGTILLGTFTDANPGATLSDFTTPPGSVVVNWGDGSPPETLTTANLTLSGSPAGVVFTVRDAHTYAEARTYAYNVAVTDDGGSVTIFSGSAIIADGALAPAPAQPAVNTVEASLFPVPVFEPPLFHGAVASFTDGNPTAPVSDFTATIDWGDGTPLTAGTVSQPGGVGTVFIVSGSHTYADSGVNGGTGTYPIQVFVVDDDGSKLTVANTANVADNPITLTGLLNPESDSGLSTGTPDVTNVTQPDFSGTSEPFSHVTLLATALPGGAPLQIGQVQAGSDGAWNIKSDVPLADGHYSITATAVDQFGITHTVAPTVITPNLLIDTKGPVIDGLFFNRLNGQVDYIIKDPGPASGGAPSGVWVNTLLDSSNYLLTKVHANKAYPGKWVVTNVTATPDPTISYAYDVAVTFNGGASIKGGFYLFTIRDSSNGNASVQDLAENHLDGVFYGSFPSGNGINGSDFVAELQGYHNKIFAPQTIIGTASSGNGGVGGLPVAPVHSGIWVPAVPRGGSPIFSTSTSPSNGGDLPAATRHRTHKVRGHIVVKTKHGESLLSTSRNHAKPKALVLSRNHPRGPKRK